MRSAGNIFLVVGYPVAVGVLTRLGRVLRERRLPWFVALEAATGCIVVGWSLRGKPLPALVNGAALVGFALAWRATGRRTDRS